MATEQITPPPAAAPVTRRGFPALVLALVALGLAAFAAWQAWQLDRSQAQRETGIAGEQASIAQRADDAARAAGAAKQALDALAQKVADAEAVNRSLREEVLGLGERAKIVEDAVSSLAERRLDGAASLRLNEADFLLRLGEERLMLFGDNAGTIAAWRLADSELAAMDDAVFAGVRQTIAAEIAQLEQAGQERRAGHLAALERLTDAAGSLPARRGLADTAPAPGSDGAWYSRALDALAQFVRINRVDPGDAALLNPLNVESARHALELELLLARAALVMGDAERHAAALARARQRLAASFDGDDGAVRDGLAALDAAIAAAGRAEPPVPGRALQELRNLRAARALADSSPRTAPAAELETPAPAPKDDAPAPEAPPPPPEDGTP
jgi:uroporphyrin-3 C-methyltransferase